MDTHNAILASSKEFVHYCKISPYGVFMEKSMSHDNDPEE